MRTRISALALAIVASFACASTPRPAELKSLDTALADANRVETLQKIAPDAVAAARNFHALADKAFQSGKKERSEHYTLLAQMSWDTALEREKMDAANQRTKAATEKKKAADASKAEQLARKAEYEGRVTRMEKILALQNQEAKTEAEKKKLEAELVKAREDQAKSAAAAAAAAQAQETVMKTDRAKLDVLEERKALLEDATKIPTASAKQDARGVVVTIHDLFASGKTDVQASAEYILLAVGKLAMKYPSYPIVVEGYTDSRGRAGDNLALSVNRAKDVVDRLVSVGQLDFSRLKSAGYGAERPIADNSTGDGRAKNRRIEIVFVFRQQ
jgi:flagellar motor protein MotB